MRSDSQANISLFSYGTLQLPRVQRAAYGGLLQGHPDALIGWALTPLRITDETVIELRKLAIHSIARRRGKVGDRIPGMVFSLTSRELAATDRYEVDDYDRVEVKLESGVKAFVYIGAEAGER